MPTLLIKNGRVIDPASGHDGDRGRVDRGRRHPRRRRESCRPPEPRFSTPAGSIVAPGFIDMHVHLREPGFEHAETIETGARAAAAGGFTSICPMPNTAPVNDNATVTSYIVEKARRHAVVNVFPIGAITKGSKGEELAAIGSMRQAGAVAISDDGRPVMNARVMRRAMEFARSFDMPVIDHCEDLHLSAGGDMHEGLESVRLGLRGIPGCSEDVMVARDILLAEVTGARYHVAHISSRHSVEMVAFAKSRGLPVTAEATPHHLALTDADMRPYDSNYKMKPPLRSAGDVSAVVEGVVQRSHRRHRHRSCAAPRQRENAGVRAVPVRHHRPGDRAGRRAGTWCIPARSACRAWWSCSPPDPARILGLDRGTLAVGRCRPTSPSSPPIAQWTYDVNKSFSKSRNSPFDGHAFRGGPVATVVAGEIVWRC